MSRPRQHEAVPQEPELEIVQWPMSAISEYDANPRILDHAVPAMVEAIRRFGFVVPVVLREMGKGRAQLVDGHLRFKAMRQLRRKTISAVMIPAGASESYVNSLRISINRLAEEADWDEEKLAAQLKELEDAGVEDLAAATGFDKREVDALIKQAIDEADLPAAELEKNVMVPAVDLTFDKNGEFDLPSFRVDRLLDMPAPRTWAGTGITNGPPPYVYNFSADSTVGLDWTQTVVAFYTADHKSEIIWSKPDEYTRRFIERGVTRAVSPNWSVYAAWPFPQRLYNIFRSRWVGRYFQEAGLHVVPDFCCSLPDLNWAFDGLPGGCPLSIQIQGKHTKRELRDTTKIIEAIFDFHPARLWVYAPKAKVDSFPILKKRPGFSVEFIEPRLVVRKQQLIGF